MSILELGKFLFNEENIGVEIKKSPILSVLKIRIFFTIQKA